MKSTIQAVISRKFLSIAALVLGVAMLTGCASSSTPAGMTVAGFQPANKHPQTVSVSTSGGTETSSTGKSQISDTAFAQAISDSISNSKTFSQVIQGKDANYLLNVTIFTMDQPSFGLSFTVKMEAGWTLRKADTGAVVWQESIKSEHTSTTSDAFAGVERLRLANEGAAKENITQGLSKLAALSL